MFEIIKNNRFTRKRQIKFFGHVMRSERLENAAMAGRMVESRSRGRTRKKYVDTMKEIIGGGTTTQEVLMATRDCEQ